MKLLKKAQSRGGQQLICVKHNACELCKTLSNEMDPVVLALGLKGGFKECILIVVTGQNFGRDSQLQI